MATFNIQQQYKIYLQSIENENSVKKCTKSEINNVHKQMKYYCYYIVLMLFGKKEGTTYSDFTVINNKSQLRININDINTTHAIYYGNIYQNIKFFR